MRQRYQLKPGADLQANSGMGYRISAHVAKGAFGEIYKASPKKPNRAGVDAIVKIPRIDDDQGLPEKMIQIGNTLTVFAFEKAMLERLTDVACVPQLIDYGDYQLGLRQAEFSVTALFLVEEFVDGQTLGDFIVNTYSPAKPGDFRGIGEAAEFFFWTRQLALAVLAVHQRRVVHGDIWQDNIIITPERKIKLIDFGQALFRELSVGGQLFEARTHPCVPPERTRSVAGDIYSVGAVLYYLATGQDVNKDLKQQLSLDEIKGRVVDNVKTINPRLYDSNYGVVDVICRCLRCDPQQRTPHALALLHDVDTMDQTPRGKESVKNITAATLKKLERKKVPIFLRIAQRRARELANVVDLMIGGIYDLIGDHDEIVGSLSEYLSFLSEGDEYLTISLPSFWYERNLGVNGRFLTMNMIAAKRGAKIRRVFILTEREVEDDLDAGAVIAAHISALEELAEAGIETRRVEKEGGYSCGFLMVTEEEREKIIRSDEHFGLLVKDNRGLVVFPVYRDDRTLGAIHFRADAEVGSNARRTFQEFESKASDLRLLPAFGADGSTVESISALDTDPSGPVLVSS